MNVESNQPLGGPSNKKIISTSSVGKIVSTSRSSSSSKSVTFADPVITSTSEEADSDGYFGCQEDKIADSSIQVASEEATNIATQ